jgi:transcriptional regulator with XRE-family HTH domain
MREARFFLKARQSAGMTQKQLAAALGYDSAQFISNIECGLSGLPNDKIRTFCTLTRARLLTYVRIKIEESRTKIRREIFS